MTYSNDLDYWIEKWQKKEQNVTACTSFWNSRARSYNQDVVLPQTSSNDVVTMLQKKRILEKGSEVLDIGCGPGRYALAMAKECKEVTALDISQEMLQYLKIHVRKLDLNNVITCKNNWEAIDLVEYGWEKKFDLVFASMTPGIYNFSTLKKMLEASRGYCYLRGFIQRETDLWDTLEKEILGENNIGKQKEDKIYYAFNVLWNLGYHPEIVYEKKNWEHQWALEEIVDLYIQKFQIKSPITEKDKEKIKQYLSSHEKGGKVIEKTKAKTAALIWKV